MANEEQMNKDMLLALHKLTDALVDSSRMTGGGGGGASGTGRAGAVANRARKQMDEELRKNYEGLRNWGKTQAAINQLLPKLVVLTKDELKTKKEHVDSLAEYNRMLAESASHLDDLGNEVNKLKGQGVFNQQRALVILTKKTNSFTSQLAQNQRSASLFNAALIESHTQISEGTFEYEKFMDDLGKATSNLDKSILKRAKIVDSETNELRKDLTDADFSQLSQIMGQAQTSITESLAGLKHIGVNSFDELAQAHAKISDKKQIHTDTDGKELPNLSAEQKAGNALGELDVASSQLHATLVKMTTDLLVQGYDLGESFKGIVVDGSITAEKMSELNTIISSGSDGGQALIAKLKNIDTELDKATKAIHAEAEARNDAVKMLGKRFSDPVAAAKDKLVAALEGFSIGASLKNLGEKLGDAAKQVSAFNIAQVPATFWSVQKASVAMGMSFEDTVKFMQENKRTMALYGDNFSTLTGGMKDTFAKFGYTMQQGAEIVGPAIESAITSGVNVKDGTALNNFIDQSMNSFKDISGIVNITAGEYMKLNAELLNSQEVAGNMVGMDQQRAKAYADDLVALRNNYVQLGLSTQQAQALMQAQQQQQREKVSSKIREAAKGMVMAQQMGMSPEDSQRYFQLAMKGNRSSAENDEFTKISQQMGVAAEQKRVNAYDQSAASGNAQDVMMENIMPTGPGGEIIKTGVQMEQAKRAGIDFTPAAARAAGDASQGSKAVADMGNVANSASSVLNNVFTKALIAASSTLVMLSLSSANLSKVLASNSIGGLIGNVGQAAGGQVGGALSKGWGGGIKGAGIGLAASAGLGIAGSALGSYADSQTEKGNTKTGAWASTASSALQGAGMLSMFGPWGMAIGAAGGALYGMYQNWGKFTDKATDAVDTIDKKASDIETAPPLTPVNTLPSDAAINAQQTMASPVPTPTPAVAGGVAAASVAAAAGVAAANSDVNKQSSTASSDSGILNVADKDSKEQLLAIADSMSTMVKLLQGISTDGLKATVDMPVGQNGTTSTRRVPSAYEYQTGKTVT